jgi:hypothetical protein
MTIRKHLEVAAQSLREAQVLLYDKDSYAKLDDMIHEINELLKGDSL